MFSLMGVFGANDEADDSDLVGGSANSLCSVRNTPNRNANPAIRCNLFL